MKLVPALAALSQNPQTPEIPQKINKDVLHPALSLAGLEFTDDQEQVMLVGINRDLAQYRRSRVRQGHRSGAPLVIENR